MTMSGYVISISIDYYEFIACYVFSLVLVSIETQCLITFCCGL